MLDLVVIGAGLTGLVAALTAAQAGMQVRVVAKGMGALHWSAATVDILGYTPANEPVDKPLTEIDRLPQSHPYTLAGIEGVQEALDWFSTEATQAAAVYCDPKTADSNLWLPSAVGAKRPAYMAPKAQIAGDLNQDIPILVVGLQGMRDFYPDLIVSNLKLQGIEARSAFLPVEILTDRTDFNTVQLAKALDMPEIQRKFGKELAALTRPGERVGLPAVLGLHDHAAVMADLCQITDAQVFEIPTLPPSVPGIRLHRALSQRLDSLGVRVEIGMEVINFHAQNGHVQWIETETSSRPLKHHAAAFLLATGGVLGGGFSGDVKGLLQEVVFDLPLDAPTNRAKWFHSEFLDPRGQPIFQAGVEVNENWQPVDATGNVVYENLWAAGGALAHADALRERSLEGLAITTGRIAALRLISKMEKSQTLS